MLVRCRSFGFHLSQAEVSRRVLTPNANRPRQLGYSKPATPVPRPALTRSESVERHLRFAFQLDWFGFVKFSTPRQLVQGRSLPQLLVPCFRLRQPTHHGRRPSARGGLLQDCSARAQCSQGSSPDRSPGGSVGRRLASSDVFQHPTLPRTLSSRLTCRTGRLVCRPTRISTPSSHSLPRMTIPSFGLTSRATPVSLSDLVASGSHVS